MPARSAPRLTRSATRPTEAGTAPGVRGRATETGSPTRTTPIPGCGEPETDYDELQLFVAFYCNIGDFMAYDEGADPAVSLLVPLADAFG